MIIIVFYMSSVSAYLSPKKGTSSILTEILSRNLINGCDMRKIKDKEFNGEIFEKSKKLKSLLKIKPQFLHPHENHNNMISATNIKNAGLMNDFEDSEII